MAHRQFSPVCMPHLCPTVQALAEAECAATGKARVRPHPGNVASRPAVAAAAAVDGSMWYQSFPVVARTGSVADGACDAAVPPIAVAAATAAMRSPGS